MGVAQVFFCAQASNHKIHENLAPRQLPAMRYNYFTLQLTGSKCFLKRASQDLLEQAGGSFRYSTSLKYHMSWRMVGTQGTQSRALIIVFKLPQLSHESHMQ